MYASFKTNFFNFFFFFENFFNFFLKKTWTKWQIHAPDPLPLQRKHFLGNICPPYVDIS